MKAQRSADAVVLEKAGKRYGKRVVLDDLSMTLASPGVVGVTGANGCGKSTLVSLIGGFARPSSGRVLVLGQPARVAARQGRVAVLSQRIQLRADERVEQLLGYVLALAQGSKKQLQMLLDKLELSRVVTHKCGELSVGYQRRVALAVALVGEPSVVVLDEPTAGLEPEAVRVVHQLIERLGESASVLVASPDPEELLAVCSQVHWLESGRLRPLDDERHEAGAGALPASSRAPVAAGLAGEETPR